LIFVGKYRKKRLNTYGNVTKGLFEEIAAVSDCSIEQMEVDQDHMNRQVKSEPRISPLANVGKLQQESTFRLWKTSGTELKRHFWKEKTFWSDGYFCWTIGNASQGTIRHSIESQGSSAAFIYEAKDLVVFSPRLV